MKVAKVIVGSLVVVAIMAVSNVEAANNGSSGGVGNAYDRCYTMCLGNTEMICEPAYEAQARGELTQEQVDAMCKCGLQICANTCVGESGFASQARPLPQICYDLNVY